MTPHDRIDTAINEAASRLMSAKPSDALRASVMSRIHLRQGFGGQVAELAGRSWLRYVFAGGAIASVALVAFVSWPNNSTIGNPTISNPTLINPTVINSNANPTAALSAPSPVTSVVKTKRVERTSARRDYAPSAAELEWMARATPALDTPDPLELKALELKSIDITPLGVAPLAVPALGDGSNR